MISIFVYLLYENGQTAMVFDRMGIGTYEEFCQALDDIKEEFSVVYRTLIMKIFKGNEIVYEETLA